MLVIYPRSKDIKDIKLVISFIQKTYNEPNAILQTTHDDAQEPKKENL